MPYNEDSILASPQVYEGTKGKMMLSRYLHVKEDIGVKLGTTYLKAGEKESYIYLISKEGYYTRFHIKELSNTIDLSEGDIVLDVACGNGTLLQELSKKAKIQAHGLDVSENMIHVAKMRYPNINFKVQSCYPLEWSDESIDIITIYHIQMLFYCRQFLILLFSYSWHFPKSQFIFLNIQLFKKLHIYAFLSKKCLSSR